MSPTKATAIEAGRRGGQSRAARSKGLEGRRTPPPELKPQVSTLGVSRESRRVTCEVSYCRDPQSRGYFCVRHGDPQKWSHTGQVTDIKCDDCGRGFSNLEPYWFHRSWPYRLEHKQPLDFKGECLDGFEGALWTHPDGRTRNYPEAA